MSGEQVCVCKGTEEAEREAEITKTTAFHIFSFYCSVFL